MKQTFRDWAELAVCLAKITGGAVALILAASIILTLCALAPVIP